MCKFLCAMLIAFTLAGCAAVVPSFDLPPGPDGAPSVGTIIQEVKCELAKLADENYQHHVFLWEQDIDVAVQLNLTVNDTGGLAPTLAYLGGPTFMFSGGALLNSSREQNFTEKLYFNIRDLERSVHRNAGTASDPRICPNIDTNLTGDLGLRQVVDLAITSPDLRTDTKLSGTDGAFGGYVKFVVMKNVNAVGPTWTLKHFKGPGGLLSASEVNTDQLLFAFARGSNHGTRFLLDDTRSLSSNVSKASELLNSIILNQISTQLSNLRL